MYIYIYIYIHTYEYTSMHNSYNCITIIYSYRLSKHELIDYSSCSITVVILIVAVIGIAPPGKYSYVVS